MRKEQIPKFKNQVDAAMIGYLKLLDRKELLSTSISIHESLVSLDPQVQRSILVIQDTIYSSLIVEAHAWLFDKSGRSSNLSLYQLLILLIDKDFKSKHLQEEYVRPRKTIALAGEGGGWRERYIENRTVEFNESFTDCVACINGLLSSGLVDRVRLLRDRLLAHKDGDYDVAGNGHTIQDVFSLLSHMKAILVSLNKLLLSNYYPISESETSARKSAEKLWCQLVST